MAKKYVYLFEEGNKDLKNLLGGKGANLAEMTNLGLPVPYGFTITTEACIEYLNSDPPQPPEGLEEQVQEALKQLERKAGRRLGDPENPLLVSVRSGARASMPGMMDTVLNLGLNDQTVQGLARLTGDERFAYDSYRRFIMMFSDVVLSGIYFPNATEDNPSPLRREVFEERLREGKARWGVREDPELPAEALKELCAEYKEIVREATGREFPSDPQEQLRLGIEAVFRSWNNPRAKTYRRLRNIPDDWGTAVNVQMMVFGNMGDDSGTGVAFTRDPATGEDQLYAEYLPNAQGEDVVAGVRTPQDIDWLAKNFPEVHQQFAEIAKQLERHYHDMQDVEFTVERGKLWMLQTRNGKRTGQAALKIAVDMLEQGLLKDHREALLQVENAGDIEQVLHPQFDEKARPQAIAKGVNASPGAGVGRAVFSADEAARRGGREKIILVRRQTSPDDIHGMSVAQGILTSEGGKTSHAAVVARQLGKPCVTGCSAVQIFPDRGECVINGHVVREGDYLSIDGSLGEVMLGEVPTVDSEVLRVLKGELSEEEAPFYRNYYKRFMEWVEEERDLGVWANADTPEDAALARRLGAEGIGLCRTEHMFFAEERLPFLQAMILAQDEGERRQALDRLRAFQREDFLGILEAMDGLPVTIRLLDPPLHEFLPQNEEDARKVAIRVGRLAARERLVEELRGKLDSLEHEKQIAALADALLEQTLPEEKALEFAAELGQTPEVLLRAAQDLHEANPMLGHRGCRLGITYPEIYEMQVRAIMEATCQLKKEGRNPQPEIMVPLVGHVNELRQLRELIERVLREVAKEQGFGAEDFHIPIGTMIELPRACVCADEIAQEADFFSFGTNDLTQTTFGISRDDAEGRFLLDYVEKYGILTHNPFEIIDREGVGELVRMGVEKGRSTKKDLKIGICGEHGGEPHSVEFCYQNDFTYVSCTSYRVPIARIAAAQARVRKLMREDGRKRRTSKRRTRRKSS